MGFWKSKRMLEAGDAAPDFELPGASGGRSRLSELTATAPTLIAFFKISCPVCQFTFPFLERLHKGAAAGRIHVVGISQDNARDTLEFNDEFGVSFATLLDTEASDYAASNAYGITNVPSLFLVDASGKVRWSNSGFAKKDLEELAKQFDVVLFQANENVPAWKAG